MPATLEKLTETATDYGYMRAINEVLALLEKLKHEDRANFTPISLAMVRVYELRRREMED